MLHDAAITQTHGLSDDAFVSPEHSTAPETSQSQTEPSSKKVEEEATPQGSKVSDASPFNHMQSLVTTHQGVTCVSSSPTMQVPSQPAGGGLGPHEKPETATAKSKCRVALAVHVGSHHQFEDT